MAGYGYWGLGQGGAQRKFPPQAPPATTHTLPAGQPSQVVAAVVPAFNPQKGAEVSARTKHRQSDGVAPVAQGLSGNCAHSFLPAQKGGAGGVGQVGHVGQRFFFRFASAPGAARPVPSPSAASTPKPRRERWSVNREVAWSKRLGSITASRHDVRGMGRLEP